MADQPADQCCTECVCVCLFISVYISDIQPERACVHLCVDVGVCPWEVRG